MDRLFVAIPIDQSHRQGLARICTGLPGMRWTPDEQIHLTLRFIGQATDEQTEAIAEALARVSHPPFDLIIQGCGVFPYDKSPRVLWAGAVASDELMELEKKVNRALRRAGCKLSRQRFHPHITIGRPRKTPARLMARYLESQALFTLPPMAVKKFCLYTSILSPAGARHYLSAEFDLGG
ncbi:MAG: RNA 2',3'-cyclic phosphodiesterase [Thermodesulfobacteriota bacterium]